MFEYRAILRVRYSETDQMGVTYHGSYIPYLEVARVESLRSLGVSYKKMEEEGVALPVVNVNINFKKPTFYDDLITVVAYIKTLPTRTFVFEYDILNSEGETISVAQSTLVFVDIKTRKPIYCPKYIIEKLSVFFNDQKSITQ